MIDLKKWRERSLNGRLLFVLETHSYAILFFLDRRRKGPLPRSIHRKGIETSNGDVDCRQEATDVFFFLGKKGGFPF